MERNFRDLMEAQWDAGKFLCIGLDTNISKIPGAARQSGVRETIIAFNKTIIDATHDLVGFYKPNSAFYEAHGELGWSALQETIEYIHEIAPEIPVILDAKRADIDTTNEGYVAAMFGNLAADAVTVHPYLGAAAIRPFLEQKEKGIFVLCRTSNSGAGEFQDLEIDGEPLYIRVASAVAKTWNEHENCGLVTGATYPEEMRKIRATVGDMPFLIPGIGTQGGDIVATVQNGRDTRGKGMIISVSRAVLYASEGEDFAGAARAKAGEIAHSIREASTV